MNLSKKDVLAVCESIWLSADRQTALRPDHRLDAWSRAFDQLLVIRSLVLWSNPDEDLIALLEWLVISSITMCAWEAGA